MEKLKNTLPLTDGIFGNMPTDIWGDDFNADDLDLELFSKVGEMYSNTLYDRLVDDIPRLSTLIYNKYNNSWKHMYDALTLDYDVAITSTNTTTITRQEVEDLFSTFNEGQETKASESKFNKITGKDVRSGSEKRNVSNSNVKNLTDKSVLNTSERTTGTDTTNSNKNLSDTSSGSDKTTNNLFQQKHDVHYKDYRDKGLGSSYMYLSKQEHDSGSDSTRDTGTSTTSKSNNQKLNETGSDVNVKNINVSNTGTDTKVLSGTDNITGSDVLTYDKLTDEKNASETGTVSGNTHTDTSNQNESVRQNTYDEVIDSKGSSPLRTFQALINEEIMLRTGEYGNIVDIMINDVRKMIAIKYIESDGDTYGS